MFSAPNDSAVAPGNSVKLVSFNVNGLRARLHQLQAVVDRHAPQWIALQETKVDDEQFPRQAVEALGYHVEFFGQKGHYGVALLSRQPPLAVQRGFAEDGETAQRRLISACYPLASGRTLTIINGYFPQGENRAHPLKFPAKERFYADLLAQLHRYDPQRDLLAVVGDMNVAAQADDVGIGAENEQRWLKAGKCCFLPEERQWLQRLLEWGLVDSFRHASPCGAANYSWFDYRSRGFEATPKRGLRIDLILASSALLAQCVGAGIDYTIRAMEKPSDHCPVWSRFDL